MKNMEYRKHYPGNGNSEKKVNFKTPKCFRKWKMTVKVVIKHFNMII